MNRISTPITFVHELRHASLSAQKDVPGPEVRFVEELRRFSEQSIPIVHAPMHDLPSIDGFLIVRLSSDLGLFWSNFDSACLAELAPRIVLIGTDRSLESEGELKTNLVAAAIDEPAFHRWRLAASTDGAWTLYGRCDIGQLAGADCLKPYTGGYCHLFSVSHLGLPHLLCDYLAVIEQARASI